MSAGRRAVAIGSELESAGFFLVRSPALPFDLLPAWADGATVEELRLHLERLVARPDVREAILVAAPAVEARLDAWLAGVISVEEARKLERTLVRYVERMCWRATPFGLCAGTRAGVVGDATRVQLDSQARRTTRLDLEYLSRVAVALAQDPAVQPHLRYRPTACVRFRSDEVFLVGARRADDGEPRAISTRRTAALEHLLRDAEPRTLRERIDDLCAAQPGLDRDEAEQLVSSLVRSDVLVDELDLPIVDADPLQHLLDRLSTVEAAQAARTALLAARDRLAALDAADGPIGRRAYEEVAEALSTLPVAPSPSPSLDRVFQVDLRLGAAHAELDRLVVAEALSGATALVRLMAGENPSLTAFRARFTARWDEQEVPLVEALDEQTGIGFDPAASTLAEAPPLLRDLQAGAAAADADEPFGPWQRWLVQQVIQAAESGAVEIAVPDAALALGRQRAPRGDSFAVVGTLHAEDETAVGEGRFRFHLQRVAGPTGASLLARFCAHDPELARRVRALTDREAALAPDAIVAEVVHAAHPRMGNVVSRPTLRAFEIPLLGSSAATGVTRLPLDDLLISARDGQVRLRSRRFGKCVLPRLTFADNTRLPGLPVYRFLAAVAEADGDSAVWSWGPLAHLPRLPRVVHGRCILQLARWRLDAAETERLAQLDEAGRTEALRRRRLPRWVMLRDRDRALPVDLSNPLSVDAFLHVARGADAVVEEMFPGPGGPFIAGPDGRHAHELILPFLRKAPRARTQVPARAEAPSSERLRFPGGDWLYAKLYCEPDAADRVLRDVVLPLVDGAGGAVDRWFFLRYGDPDCHLRVRLHGAPEALREVVLPSLAQLATKARGWIRRVALDTYDPEWERYGGAANAADVERLFCHDSAAALSLAVVYARDADARWRLALAGMHRLARRLVADDAERIEIVAAAREALAGEAGLVGRAGRVLGDRFRTEQAALFALLGRDLADGHPLLLGLDILDERDANLEPVAAALTERLARDTSWPRLVRSLLHLHVNRVLPSHHRLQEAFLYDFLERVLRAEHARAQSHRRRAEGGTP